MKSLKLCLWTAWLCMVLPSEAFATVYKFQDPVGDDFGPGAYVYPTDSTYRRGSFDIREVEIRPRGGKIQFRVTLAAPIDDPWDSKSWNGNGFSLQMVQIYIDQDAKLKSGFTRVLPGLNASFSDEDAWDKMVIISPQPSSRILSELTSKASDMKAAVVIPVKITVKGKTIIADVKTRDLGGQPAGAWGIQAVMQSNEGYPTDNDILSRPVNEYPGKHRFGGGNDYNCDPHILDILVTPAKGENAEVEAQKKALSYECGKEGASLKKAVLPMVRLAR